MNGKEFKNILFVDDDPDLCALIKHIFLKQKYMITCVKNGFDALRFFEQKGNNLSLILTDINMPKMTGYQLAVALKARGSNIPVILLSGNCEMLQSLSYRSMGVKCCIHKPFVADELRQKVCEVMHDF